MDVRILSTIRWFKSRGAAVSILIVALLSAGAISVNHVHAASGVNCDGNAVIFCGGSTSALSSKFFNGDGHNSAASIQHIFSWFGISSNEMSSLGQTGQEGSVTRSGEVFVGGKLVATGALTGGRDCSIGGTQHIVMGTKFCSRPPSVSFISSPLSAVIVMQNGVFKFAILHSCGNPVIAHPVTPPPVPKPTPKPTPVKPTPARPPSSNVNICNGNTANSNSGIAAQGGNCSTNTTVVQTQTSTPTPSPAAPVCDTLGIFKGDNRTVTITTFQTSANGSTFTSADINWGDDSTMSGVTTVVGQTHQFASDGPFTISAVAHFMINGQEVAVGGPSCQQQVSFTTPVTPPAQVTPTPPSPAPVTTSAATTPSQPSRLVNTGPGGIFGIFGIATILGTAGYSLFLRRHLKP